MAEYSRIARGSFASTGAARAIYLPFVPDQVEIWNTTAAGTPAQNGIPYAFWDRALGQGAAQYQIFNATPVLTTDTVTANGFSTFEAGLLFQYGAAQQVVSISKASPANVEVTAHGYSTGDIVVLDDLFQTATTGMPQISGVQFQITVVDANNFTIPWNTNQSNYTALAASPAGASVRKVLYPYLYAPGKAVITYLTRGTTTTVVTTEPHNMVVGQQVAFRIPSGWGTIELNSLPNEQIPGSPKYGYVVSVTDARTVVVSIDSSAYTAFDSNQLANPISGLQLPYMVAVGDVNSGGWPITAGSALYPSPIVNGARTINGPAIQGAFINNTRQGFVVGSALVGASSDVICYRATMADYS